MSLTGAFLILFVKFLVLMNGVALFWPTAYNEVCLFLGANWYALIGTLVLAAGFVLHIIYAIWLTIQNRKARGSQRYAVTARQPQVEWSSKNMLVLGIVVLAFLLVHLYQFWAKMQLAEIAGFEAIDPVTGEAIPAAAGTWFIQLAFQNPVTLVIYLIGFIALWFHMTHGFWSMFQTVGWNGKVWMNRLKCIGTVWATCVVLQFAVEAIVFTVQANKASTPSAPPCSSSTWICLKMAKPSASRRLPAQHQSAPRPSASRLKNAPRPYATALLLPTNPTITTKHLFRYGRY